MITRWPTMSISRALAGRSMWGTMAKARLLQKTFTLPFCSFKFCSWFSTRKKAKLQLKDIFAPSSSSLPSPRFEKRISAEDFATLSLSFSVLPLPTRNMEGEGFFPKKTILGSWNERIMGREKSEKVANGLFWTFHLDVQQQQIVSDPCEEQWWGRV